jgi:Carbohydrate-selective porin, OprB family
MSNNINKTLKIGSGVLGALLLATASVHAETTPTQTADSTLEQVNQYQDVDNNATNNDTMGETVNNVDQLSDVKPSDWAYEALKDLASRYNCLTTPNGVTDAFQGNRSLTRYEFTDGLNLCLSQIEKLIGNVGNDFIKKDDLAQLGRLSQEFKAELDTIYTKLDQVESRTAKLEGSQFSTTTKLNAEVIFNVAAFGGDKYLTGQPPTQAKVNDNQVFTDRVRLNFDSSFTGKDLLRTRLQARNNTGFNAATGGSPMTSFGFGGGTDNSAELSRLQYTTPLTDKVKINIAAIGGEFNDFVPNYNPLFADAGTGSISRFGRYAPIYRQSDNGAGASLDYMFSKQVSLSLGYLVPSGVANDPTPSKGFFNGTYSALAQLNFKPSDSFNLAFTYINAYYNPGSVSVSGATGSTFANAPFGNSKTSANHFGVEANYRFSPKFTAGAWFGYTEATAEAANVTTGATRGQKADLINWAVSLGLPDFGGKGNQLGFIFGMPPKVTDNQLTARRDSDTSYHLEALYRYQMNKNVSITPGILVILNPDHTQGNDAVWVGTLRTTFKF